MKKSILVYGFFVITLLWLLPSVQGQGKVHKSGSSNPEWKQVYSIPSHNPVPTKGSVVVLPKKSVVVELPSNFRIVEPKVVRPVVIVPEKRPTVVVREVNHFVSQPKPTVIVKRPIIVVPERTKIIHQNWQAALARPRPVVDYSVAYRPFSVQIQTRFRPVQNQWFNQKWWNNHVDVARRHPWHYSHQFNLHPHDYWWRHANWNGLRTWIVVPWGPPVFYDYGGNVLFQNNRVLIHGVPVASDEEFASQAFALAEVPPPPVGLKIDWMPLGTFAMTSSREDLQPNQILQLAVSRQGLISGTRFNRVTGKVMAAEGRVDPATQRVAIRFPERPDMVLETGLYNLTQDQTPVLAHFGINRTQIWYLVRLQGE